MHKQRFHPEYVLTETLSDEAHKQQPTKQHPKHFCDLNWMFDDALCFYIKNTYAHKSKKSH